MIYIIFTLMKLFSEPSCFVGVESSWKRLLSSGQRNDSTQDKGEQLALICSKEKVDPKHTSVIQSLIVLEIKTQQTSTHSPQSTYHTRHYTILTPILQHFATIRVRGRYALRLFSVLASRWRNGLPLNVLLAESLSVDLKT